jgi:high-affinity Fe2+/Pb2+ permease
MQTNSFEESSSGAIWPGVFGGVVAAVCTGAVLFCAAFIRINRKMFLAEMSYAEAVV